MIKTNHTFCAEFYDGTLRVTLEGEIDHHSAVATRGEIDRLIYEYRPRRFELALSRIGFMDSSGLGLVMGRYTLVHDLGGEMVVLDPSPAILRIFKLAGMDRLIRIEYGEKPQAVPKTDNGEKGEE
jgi:stage II sporulation protein AA (anti-sigma F factor antagonist)